MPLLSPAVLPSGPLVTWYGDDFTGSAAVLETMQFATLPSILLLAPPRRTELPALAKYRGIGIAGQARARSPQWMARELPPVFSALSAIGAAVAHYKICSTLDSSPSIGSIGAAIDLALPSLGGAWTPIVTAAPTVGRHQAFGNLFAVNGGRRYRLDRHPVMSTHPVTPMDESDVARHIARQTQRPIGLIDLFDLDDAPAALDREQAAGNALVSVDMVDDADMVSVGRLIWESRGDRLLTIGSQGIEDALVAYWQSAGLLAPVAAPGIRAVSQLAAVSGSLSRVTRAQLGFAQAHGFDIVGLDAASCLDPASAEGAMQAAVTAALLVLARGRSPIVTSAGATDDAFLVAFRQAASRMLLSQQEASERLGSCLGLILRQIQTTSGVGRLVVAGGDTSGDVCMALGVHALTAIGLTVPGAALLAAHGPDLRPLPFDIALKGGQMGTTDYFVWLREGRRHL